MSRQLSKEDVLRAKEIHLYMDNIIYVVLDDSDKVYGIEKGSAEWKEKDDFYDYFDSELMMSYFSTLLAEEAVSILEDWQRNETQEEHILSGINNDKIRQAIYFATERHAGQCRKGTHTPFIIHPMETMTILASMKADINLLVAGLLHDTVEDTDTTIEEIRQLFGKDVSELVGGHTEDKSRFWEERKQTEIDDCKAASERLKMLILADKLANLRSMYVDYREEGEDFWKRFRAPKEKQAWYYGGVQDALFEMQHYSNTAQAYWEMVDLYKDIFVSFMVDKSKGLLYQICADGESYCLRKGNPEWKPFEGKVSKKAERLPRKQAERLEENWSEPFYNKLDDDLQDAVYEVFSDVGRHLEIRVTDRKIIFSGHDLGELGSTSEDGEYEFFYSLDAESAYFLLTQLRMKHGIRKRLATILKVEFGVEGGVVRFAEMCKSLGIEPGFHSC